MIWDYYIILIKTSNFANKLGRFCKINKINLIFVSSISALKVTIQNTEL